MCLSVESGLVVIGVLDIQRAQTVTRSGTQVALNRFQQPLTLALVVNLVAHANFSGLKSVLIRRVPALASGSKPRGSSYQKIDTKYLGF